MGHQQEFQGKGLELLQALYDQYQPNDGVTLPLVFTDWSHLAQQVDEESLKFSGRVCELALRSKNSGQPYTEASQCLAFLSGLNSNFNYFSQDYFSGRSDIRSLTTLATITSQTQSLECTFSSKGKLKTFGSTSTPTPAAARKSAPAAPGTGPFSDPALDNYIKRGKCPIHRMTNNSLADYGFLERHDYHCVLTSNTPDVSAGAGRHVSFPPARTTPPVQSPAPAAPQPAPASVPAPSPAIGRATYASALPSFPPAPSDNDDISVGYDFIGSDGHSSNTTTSEAPTPYYAPCFVDEEQCPTPFIVPPSHSSVLWLPSAMDPPSTSVPDLRLLHVPSVPQLEHPTPSNPPHGAPSGSILRFSHTLRVCVNTASMAHPQSTLP